MNIENLSTKGGMVFESALTNEQRAARDRRISRDLDDAAKHLKIGADFLLSVMREPLLTQESVELLTDQVEAMLVARGLASRAAFRAQDFASWAQSAAEKQTAVSAR